MAAELVFFALEQHVECGEGAVAASDVLLELDFLFFAQGIVAVDLLFEDAELVADHDELAVIPTVTHIDVADAELVE